MVLAAAFLSPASCLSRAWTTNPHQHTCPNDVPYACQATVGHKEILWLAARDNQAGCRRLADIFNRRHTASDGMTVGKSFVADTLRRHAYEVIRLRRDLRKRRYKPGRPNVVWGMDGTGKSDEQGTLHFLLGVVDHGTRRCLTLEALKNKASITILRTLLDTIAIRRPQSYTHRQRGDFSQPVVSDRAASARHSSPSHRTSLPVAERTDRALLRHAQGQARSLGRCRRRGVEQLAGDVLCLVQPRATAPASASTHACGGMGPLRYPAPADPAGMVRGMGRIATGRILAALISTATNPTVRCAEG